MWCWGEGDNAQLGDGGAFDQEVPRQVVGLPECVSVAAGTMGSCALDKRGQVWCWGYGVYGMLGDGGDGPEYARGWPTVVPVTSAVASTVCKTLNCDDGNPCSVDGCDGNGACTHAKAADGKPCGGGNFCHAGTCKWASAIAAGDHHTCALRPDGSTWCWGRNLHGQVGNGGFGGIQAAPGIVVAAKTGVSLAARADTTCAVQAGGGVQCWGGGESCQFGGAPGDQAQAVALQGAKDVVRVAVGTNHLCAVDKLAQTLCVGSNVSGELGIGAASFQPSCALQQAKGSSAAGYPGSIAAGNAFVCTNGGNGIMTFWGSNAQGQLSPFSKATAPAPEALSTAYVSVTAGDDYTCAVTNGKGVVCWGGNAYGQCNGAPSTGSVGFGSATAGTAQTASVVAGKAHTCALGLDKTVKCWGRGDNGQLGNASGPASGVVAVGGLYAVDQVAAGGAHTCALDAAGQVWCWGSNEFGQL
ncbi:MAG: hypothetical protein FJ100_04645, partial [Deltaproteobacteria bacterium]|nr:hypothetical protein [Deltaproteobacteria bacterium]